MVMSEAGKANKTVWLTGGLAERVWCLASWSEFARLRLAATAWHGIDGWTAASGQVGMVVMMRRDY
jgi:hypothetical protein